MNEEVVKSNQMLEQEDEYGNLARDIGKIYRCISLEIFSCLVFRWPSVVFVETRVSSSEFKSVFR